MTSKSQADKYQVCFVSNKKSNDDVSENLKNAFDAMGVHDIEPTWVTEEFCLQINTKEPKLFVLDPFKGKVYDHLKFHNCRIVGPLCILRCLQLNDTLPKRPHPVYSVAMRGLTLTCSNVEKKLREELSTKIQLMGGNFSKDLTKSVTHLIAGGVGSKKYHVAASFGLQIMLPEWVTELWNNGQHNHVHATDPVYDKFKCPIFKGLSITVSQLGTEERTTLKAAIEENGGRYSGALKSRETTHLVLLEPHGEKYNFAKSWKLHCVKVDWLYDSLKAGYCVDEVLYKLDESSVQKRSTPIKEKESERLSVDFSTINVSMISHLDETTRVDYSVVLKNKLNTSLNEIDAFDISSLPKFGQFLDGCKIYLCGFKGLQLEKLRKIVNAGGGMRFSKYSDSISHVVCCEKDETLWGLIKNSPVKPHVVTFHWLLECSKLQKIADEGPFVFPGLITDSTHSTSESSTVHKNSTTLCNDEADLPTRMVTDNLSKTAASLFGKDITISNEILKQYASVPADNQSVINVVKENEDNLVPECSKSTQVAENVNESDQNKSITVSVHDQSIDDTSENETSGLFQRKKFQILGFGPKEVELLANMIVANSGIIVDLPCSDIADIAVVPLIWNGNVMNGMTVVTNCWLQKCIEENTLLAFDYNELFKPFDISDTKQPLQNLVISISQFAGTERDCLMHLAEVLGAHCQEYFVRKVNQKRGLLPNTHLIACTPDGSKYEAAKKWKIPAVTKYWLLAAARMDAIPPVDSFLVDDELPATQVNEMVHFKAASNVPSPKQNVETTPDISSGKNFNLEGKKTEQQESKWGSESVAVAPNIRVVELIESERKFSPKRSESDDLHNKTNDSMSLDKSNDGLPKFDISGMLAAFDSSPEENYGKNKRKASLPLQEALSNNFRIALKNVGYVSSPDNQEPKSKGEENGANDVLKDVVLCVSKKLSNLQSELNKIVTSLGGQYRWAYDSICTHYVFQGKTNDSSKEFRDAKRHGKKIVSPDWVYACRDANSRVNEDCYPHTYKPRLSLVDQISTHKASTSEAKQSVTEKDSSQFSPKNVKVSPPKLLQVSPLKVTENENGETPKGNQASVNVINELTSLHELIKSASTAKRRCRQRTTSSSSPIDKNNGATINVLPSTYANIYTHSDFKSDLHNVDTVFSEPSQSVPITWDDPTGRMEREKIAAATQEAKEEGLNAGSLNEVTSSKNFSDVNADQVHLDEVDMLSLNSTDFNGKSFCIKKFMLTSLSESDKDKYSLIINELGGVVSDSKFFDETATHLILGQALKNEKFLASVASGKWVLHPSYLSDSASNKNFLAEDAYEWGGERTQSFIQNASGNVSMATSMCPKRWRQKLTEEKASMQGAFHDWKVVIVSEKNKSNSYSKILKAGAAEIFPLSSLESSNIDLTHAFVELGKNATAANYQEILEILLSYNVKCVKPEYLAFYLIEDPPPSADDYILPQAKELLLSAQIKDAAKRHSPDNEPKSKRFCKME